MNTEVQKILETLKPFHPGLVLDRYDTANIQKVISIETARLHAILADQQADSAAKMERFTFWLIVLTIVLVVIGVGQVALMLCGHQ